jgi:hypothetical protein
VETQTQLSIFLENRPGTFQRVAESLGEQGINVLGFAVNDAIDHAVVRMIVDEPTKAVHLLEEAGVLVLEAEVLALNLANQPGRLAAVCGALQEAGININYAYGSTGGEGSHVIYLSTTDLDKTREVLGSIAG